MNRGARQFLISDFEFLIPGSEWSSGPESAIRNSKSEIRSPAMRDRPCIHMIACIARALSSAVSVVGRHGRMEVLDA